MSWGEGYENGSDGTKVFDVRKGLSGSGTWKKADPLPGIRDSTRMQPQTGTMVMTW